jgi:excisionase family DNA binding protein
MATRETEPEYWKPAELAKKFRVDQRVIYGMIERGDLKAIRVGRVLRIPSDALAALTAKKPPGSAKESGARAKRHA